MNIYSARELISLNIFFKDLKSEWEKINRELF